MHAEGGTQSLMHAEGGMLSLMRVAEGMRVPTQGAGVMLALMPEAESAMLMQALDGIDYREEDIKPQTKSCTARYVKILSSRIKKMLYLD